MAEGEQQAADQLEEFEFYLTHKLPADQGSNTYAMGRHEYWKCFHCGETFTADQEDEARKHFGHLPPAMPACWYGKDALIALLRAYEKQHQIYLEGIGELVIAIAGIQDENPNPT